MTTATVADVMTRAVVMAGAMTPESEIAALLGRLGISGVPIVDELGRPLGFVSEGDLLGRQRGTTTYDAGVWLDWMPPPAQRGPSTVVAAQLMSSPPQTVTPQTPLDEAARLLLTADRRRLLVVDTADRVIGIVTRRDLLRTFLTPDHGATGRGVDSVSKLAQEPEEMRLTQTSLA